MDTITDTLRELQNDALESSFHHGHYITHFEPLAIDVSLGVCEDCGMEVVCNAHPSPNSIDISGQAVACDCETL